MASFEGNVDLSVGGYSLKRVQHTKCLGVHIDENLTWSEHVNHILKKVVCNYQCSQENITLSYSR